VRYRRVSSIGVVLDEEESSARLQVSSNELDDRLLRSLKVQCVRHYRPLEWGQIQSTREVGVMVVDLHVWKSTEHSLLLPLECVLIPVYGVDDGAGSEQLGKRQGEGSIARAEVGPSAGASGDALLQKPHMIFVVHFASTTQRRSKVRVSREKALGQRKEGPRRGLLIGRSYATRSGKRRSWDASSG
jgi:hypothetical protein